MLSDRRPNRAHAVRLADVVLAGMRLTLKSWLLLLLQFFIATASALASLLPILLIFVVVFRLTFAAIQLQGQDEHAVLRMLDGFASNHLNMVAIAAIITLVALFQVLLRALLDAGIAGELAGAIRDRREVSISGFLSHALGLLDRMLGLRILFEIAKTVVYSGLAVLVAGVLLWLFQYQPSGTGERVLAALVLAGAATLALVLSGLLYGVAAGAMAAVGFEHMSLTRALTRGLFMLRRYPSKLAVFGAFMLVAVGFSVLLAELGDHWFSAISQGRSAPDWGFRAALSWAFAYLAFMEVLWFYALASFFLLYRRLTVAATAASRENRPARHLPFIAPTRF